MGPPLMVPHLRRIDTDENGGEDRKAHGAAPEYISAVGGVMKVDEEPCAPFHEKRAFQLAGLPQELQYVGREGVRFEGQFVDPSVDRLEGHDITFSGEYLLRIDELPVSFSSEGHAVQGHSGTDAQSITKRGVRWRLGSPAGVTPDQHQRQRADQGYRGCTSAVQSPDSVPHPGQNRHPAWSSSPHSPQGVSRRSLPQKGQKLTTDRSGKSARHQ